MIAELTQRQQPRLELFRNPPANLAEHPPLASSLQSFETCLFLIALARYPSALVSCGSAIEGVLKAKLQIAADKEVKLSELLDDIFCRYPNLRLSGTKLNEFRNARNRIVHYGYSPADDHLSTLLLLQVGLPFLKRSYAELFQIPLDWRETHPGSDSLFHCRTKLEPR